MVFVQAEDGIRGYDVTGVQTCALPILHDVWVHDGIAYSSEWQNGVVVVDVGNGRWGGSIENPVFVTRVPYPVGATHAAFPYFQESTGKFYLFLGDEIGGGRGRAWAGPGRDNRPYDPETGEGGIQGRMDGYLHVIDFTDPENPKDVARYEVPEAGTHNSWVEDRKSTRLNSSHVVISYAVFCLKKTRSFVP